MKLILKVIGITHVVIAHGEGAEVVDIGAATMEAFVEIDTAG